ncbi:hypothetical protein KFU94_42500 [Chloroflexi bacterium TSY]|nr:hypothetical protein [Chloroflexi bacterium TSY]
MTTEHVQILAGSISSLIFVSGTLSMLLKTWRTHNVDSYSMISLVLNHFGNLLYWIYVISLPVGPIYIMHGFYTVANLLMLIWYFRYRHQPETTEPAKRIAQTIQIPILGLLTRTLKKVYFSGTSSETTLKRLLEIASFSVPRFMRHQLPESHYCLIWGHSGAAMFENRFIGLVEGKS